MVLINWRLKLKAPLQKDSQSTAYAFCSKKYTMLYHWLVFEADENMMIYYEHHALAPLPGWPEKSLLRSHVDVVVRGIRIIQE